MAMRNFPCWPEAGKGIMIPRFRTLKAAFWSFFAFIKEM